jgi:hypothetical protein
MSLGQQHMVVCAPSIIFRCCPRLGLPPSFFIDHIGQFMCILGFVKYARFLPAYAMTEWRSPVHEGRAHHPLIHSGILHLTVSPKVPHQHYPDPDSLINRAHWSPKVEFAIRCFRERSLLLLLLLPSRALSALRHVRTGCANEL